MAAAASAFNATRVSTLFCIFSRRRHPPIPLRQHFPISLRRALYLSSSVRTMASSATSPDAQLAEKITAPYGSWMSPITADVVSGAEKRLGGFAVAGDGRLVWIETRPDEGGFPVVADVIAAVYGLLQCIRCVTIMVRSGNIFGMPLAWVIILGDQLLAYLMFTAVVAAVESAVLGQFGQTELGWMGIASLFGKFCNQIGEGAASSLVASLSMVALSCVSAFNLFRLYGDSNKVENNESW